MVYKQKYLLGIFGLLLVLHSFLLNAHVVDLLLAPSDEDVALVVDQQQNTPSAPVFKSHNLFSKHLSAPVESGKHQHSKHKSPKHTGFKILLDKSVETQYTSVKLNRDIHTAGQVSYFYLYFREINPPPPKFC